MGEVNVKKFLFWAVVIVGIVAAVAVMKRRSGSEDDSWQGYLEDAKEPVTNAVDVAAEGTKDVIDLSVDTSKDVADEATDAAAKAKRATS